MQDGFLVLIHFRDQDVACWTQSPSLGDFHSLVVHPSQEHHGCDSSPMQDGFLMWELFGRGVNCLPQNPS